MRSTTSGPPHSFGWLRRSELDVHYNGDQVWERPDGALMLHPKDAPPLVITKWRGGKLKLDGPIE